MDKTRFDPMTAEVAALARELQVVASRLLEALHSEPAERSDPGEPSGSVDAGDPVRLLTATEVAERLSLPRARVYALSREGRIGGTVRIGSQVRFHPQVLDEWVRTGGASER